MPSRRIVLLLFTLLTAPTVAYAGDSGEIHDWEQVKSLAAGTHVWVRSRSAPLTELVLAQVTEDTLRAGVLSEMEDSKASEDQILSRCAVPSDSRFVVRGEVQDFTRLCRTLSRDEVLEVHARQKKSPLRSILIGTGVAAAIMFAPCGVASQADGSAAGCLMSSAGLGAAMGWAVHGLRRGERVLIYQAEDNAPEWEDLAIGSEGLEELNGDSHDSHQFLTLPPREEVLSWPE